MSQEYHHHHHNQTANIFTSFPHGFDRSTGLTQTTLDPVQVTGLEHYHLDHGQMLSEMFNFQHGPSPGHRPGPELLDYRRAVSGPSPTEWYKDDQQMGGGISEHVLHDSAISMQLFLRNPPPTSPSPPQQPPQPAVGGGGILSIRNNNNFLNPLQISNPGELTRVVESQGLLSLSLSSSHSGHFFNSRSTGGFGGPSSGENPVHIGFGSTATSSLGMVNVLRNTKYAKPTQELLDEFCSVGRGQIKKVKLGRQNSSTLNPTSSDGGDDGGGGGASSSVKDPPQVTPADRVEHQRRKVKLVAMLDEVDRRYTNYCEQMQMVVNSFDLIMGYGASIPYTLLAQKAMSRHFRCLKDAIHIQLKHSCELLGEKDPTTSCGLTKGETPRLKVLEQSLRQQKAFHQMGLMDQETWRPQRGLPERSVNILRAWLFGHFLNPYPSDADKQLLSRQTGLSRNQVSNWFINARVRLWKPMIEEMYQQESKELEEEEERDREGNQSTNNTSNSFPTTHDHHQQYGQHSNDSMTTMGPPFDNDEQHHPPTLSQLPYKADGVNLLLQSRPQDTMGPNTMITFVTTSDHVSLTLGLQHAGIESGKGHVFSFRDFIGR